MKNIKNQIKRLTNTKQFHTYIISLIIFAILFVAGMVSLIYNVEGESNLPFHLSKISVISSVDGINVEDETNKWNVNVNQNNDIYLSIDKNNKYGKLDAIESIKIDNFNIVKNSNIGKIEIFKTDSNNEKIIFKNIEKNKSEFIEYIGDVDSNIKEQKISNQGGLVVFRYSVTDIANYISNDDIEINYNDLLKKLNVNNDDLKFEATFDICIKLVSGKSYIANINLKFPVNDVVNNGIQSIEYTDLKNIAFKRL